MAKSKQTDVDVALYGATGYTGSLTAHALERLGLPMVLAGRNELSLKRLSDELGGEHPTHVAAHDDAMALLDLAHRAKVLATCAGPFSQVGELVVAAAVEAGIHYIDTTGENAFMALTHLRHDTAAREKGIVVMNSCAFEYVLGDCAMDIALSDRPDARQVRVSYLIPDKAMTHGTARTTLNALGGNGGSLRPHPERVDFPGEGVHWAVTYPGGELEFLRRRRPEIKIETLMDMPPMVARTTALMPVVAGVMAIPGVKQLIDRRISRLPAGPDAETRERQTFVILVEVDPRTADRSGVVVRGFDPYGLTAEIQARTAARLVRGEAKASGVLAPSEAFDAEETLNSLADLGVSWERIL